jgi:hypothetical protein
MRRAFVAVIVQGAGLILVNVGVFVWSVPAGFHHAGLDGRPGRRHFGAN